MLLLNAWPVHKNRMYRLKLTLPTVQISVPSCMGEVFLKIYIAQFSHAGSIIYVTGPAKRDQVGTKYTISQHDTYLEYCVQYLLSVSCSYDFTYGIVN